MNMDELKKQVAALELEVEKQGALVKQLKANGKSKQDVQPDIDRLIALKQKLAEHSAKLDASTKPAFDRQAFEEMCKKKFFYNISFAPYGGVSGLFDYGPPGAALQSNIIQLWRNHFVLEEDMLEVDCSILTPHDVLKTSGHVDRFADLMCKDIKTGDIYRVDHLVEHELERRLKQEQDRQAGKLKSKEEVKPLSKEEKAEYESILAQIDGYNSEQLSGIIKKYTIKSPLANDLSDPEVFNLMFGTPIGPTGLLKGYLRPETAQGQFLNFKKLYEYNNERMPFASASIGKSFRNEISPRSGLLRVREFTMAEIEHFVNPKHKDHPRFAEVKDVELNLLPSATQMQGKATTSLIKVSDAVQQGIINNQTLGYFMARIHLFLIRIGVNPDRFRFRQHLRNEMAHYACDCWDAEIQSSYGWIECVGCADRSAYDLTKHSERTKERLVAREVLDKPMSVTKMKASLNKKLFGPAFKKDAKDAEASLMALGEEDLKSLKAALDKDGKAAFSYTKSADGAVVKAELTAQMVTIESVTETVHVVDYVPNVIEPSFGIGRILYSLLEHSWYQRAQTGPGETRNVLSFPPAVAPTKCLLVPLSANAVFTPLLTKIKSLLRLANLSHRLDDSSGAIGRRYSRNDEIGIPFAITVDFQSVQDQTVTLRERDSMEQIRTDAETVVDLVRRMCEERLKWKDVIKQYPVFTKQDLGDEEQ